MTVQQCDAVCSVEGCERPHKARGYCMAHYCQLWKAGLPDRRRTARWSKALADDIDEAVVHNLTSGIPVESYTSYERRQAVAVLRRRGMSLARIGLTVGTSEWQVCRDLRAPQLVRPSRDSGLARLGLVQKGQQR